MKREDWPCILILLWNWLSWRQLWFKHCYSVSCLLPQFGLTCDVSLVQVSNQGCLKACTTPMYVVCALIRVFGGRSWYDVGWMSKVNSLYFARSMCRDLEDKTCVMTTPSEFANWAKCQASDTHCVACVMSPLLPTVLTVLVLPQTQISPHANDIGGPQLATCQLPVSLQLAAHWLPVGPPCHFGILGFIPPQPHHMGG